ncbi:DUF899 family protein [Immundisolibacter sp.]|uniref:DUF899 family protein n=1 Tax=Immundisolibacter sp. TaxID=1934948 RepID=UPI00356AC82E
MSQHHALQFPGESAAYRSARDALLEAESALRRQLENVAALRRTLPPGGALAQDYDFADAATGEQVRLSELFSPGHDTLVVYGYMYAPQAAAPCPLCTSMLDSLAGAAAHLAQHLDLVVVAKAAPQQLKAVADERGWGGLRLLSWGNTTFGRDYLTETADGAQMPMLNVFQRSASGIHHAWGSELLYAPREPGLHSRHVDLMWPLWNVLDFTPAGRGGDWLPRLHYD